MQQGPPEASSLEQQWLERTFTIIDSNIVNKQNVYIYDRKGSSRLAALVLMYLMNRFGLSYGEALTYLKSIRGTIKVKESHEEMLKVYESKFHTTNPSETDTKSKLKGAQQTKEP
jgi:hypothetical protein